MARDYVPSSDPNLKAWMANFLAVLEPIITDFGMLATDLDVLKNFNLAHDSCTDVFVQAQSEYKTASADRKTSRANLLGMLRPLVGRINHHPAMTDGIRQSLGLKPHNLVEEPTPIDQMTPKIDLVAVNGAVMVHWGPNPSNERINGRPDGVKSANIYRKRTGDAVYALIGNAPTSPYRDPIAGNAADYTYVVRYRGSKATDLSNESLAASIAAGGELAA